MRDSWVRTAVAVLFAILYVASGVVAAFGLCCGHGDATVPKMECCLKGGEGHICPFMTKRTHTSTTGGEVKATCAAGHDAGVPVTGFGAPPVPQVAIVHVEASSVLAQPAIVPRHGRDLHPPSPPPKA